MASELQIHSPEGDIGMEITKPLTFLHQIAYHVEQTPTNGEAPIMVPIQAHADIAHNFQKFQKCFELICIFFLLY